MGVPWPLFGLVLRSARLELRPPADDDLRRPLEGNEASRRVSMKLGYRPDGLGEVAPRGTPVREERFVLDRSDLDRESWPLAVDGFDTCRAMFGLD